VAFAKGNMPPLRLRSRVCPDIRCTGPVPGTPPVHCSEEPTWDGDRKIGDGTHRRGIVNVVEFEERFGVRQLATSLD